MQRTHRLVCASALTLAVAIAGWPEGREQGSTAGRRSALELPPPGIASVRRIDATAVSIGSASGTPAALDRAPAMIPAAAATRDVEQGPSPEAAPILEESTSHEPSSYTLDGRPTIEFEPVEIAPGAVSLRVRAIDHRAPRHLTLWRLAGEEASAIAEARHCGASELQLEVRARNRGAFEFYAALHFEVVGSRPRYYRDGDDALLLSRSLAG